MMNYKKQLMLGGKLDESVEIWFPVYVYYENLIAILESNTQYGKQFDAQLEGGMVAFDATLNSVQSELHLASELCQKAKINMPKSGSLDNSTHI